MIDELQRLRDENEALRADNRAVKRMMIRRATLVDHWRARRKKGYWLNCFRHEVLIP